VPDGCAIPPPIVALRLPAFARSAMIALYFPDAGAWHAERHLTRPRARAAEPTQPRRCAGATGVERDAGNNPEPPLGARFSAGCIAGGGVGVARGGWAIRVHSSNLQVWSVVAVREPERKSRLAELAGKQQFIRDAPLLLIWLADLNRLDSIAADRQSQVEGAQYTEAFILGIVDATLAAQSAFIAAESIGLGAVYIGAMRNLPEQIAAELNLPPHVFAVFGMSVGYPDPAKVTGVKPRLPQEVVLHREQYDQGLKRDAIEKYNGVARGYMREQGMKEQDWTFQAINRLKDVAALHGRDRMREALRNLGFELR
jgi:nitroreductase